MPHTEPLTHLEMAEILKKPIKHSSPKIEKCRFDKNAFLALFDRRFETGTTIKNNKKK